jgi:hypothetical protein
MLRISRTAGVSSASAASAGRARRADPAGAPPPQGATRNAAEPAAPAGAVEPVGDEQAERSFARAARPYAPFIAQLIAAKLGFSQMRARRRASFGEAAAAYDAGGSTERAAAGRTV